MRRLAVGDVAACTLTSAARPPASPTSWLSRKSGSSRPSSAQRKTSSQWVAGLSLPVIPALPTAALGVVAAGLSHRDRNTGCGFKRM
eukprot:7382932-Prymnesium_polylepis.1